MMYAGPDMSHPSVLQSAALKRIPGLVHGFCGRRGGVSSGPFASLNVSRRVGDDAGAVRENWRRVQSLAPPGGHFATMQQVHSTNVAVVGNDAADAGEADALVTAAAGVWLPVLTADCVPVFLVAPRTRVAAAVHAGWRGAAAGIVQRTLRLLGEAYGVVAGEVVAALGPAIDGCCYEVGSEVAEALASCANAAPAEDVWATAAGSGRARVDLRACLTGQLIGAGVSPGRVARVGPCTRCAAGEYFSHRASGGQTGRQVSFVGWRAAL